MGQAGAPVASLAGGQPGLMRRPSEALSQPALDPLLAAFSAQMGVGQVRNSKSDTKHHSTPATWLLHVSLCTITLFI